MRHHLKTLLILLVCLSWQSVEAQMQTAEEGQVVSNPFAKYNRLLKTKFPIDQTLVSIDGTTTTLKTYRGKPVLINFWFTACPPCVEEIPALNSLKETFEGQVQFLAITFNSGDKVRSFLNKRAFNFDQYVNAQKLLDSFGIDTYPLSFFIDKEGIIQYIEGPIPVNERDESMVESFDEIIKKLL